jgi:hypothetical protein
MKLLFSYKKYFEMSSNLRLDFENIDGSVIKNIKWVIDDLTVGIFAYILYDDYVMIMGYNKYKDVPKGVGYKFIKMCIEDLLTKHKGVFSAERGRSLYSDIVWRKLEKEYDVVDTELRGYKGKMIYCI